MGSRRCFICRVWHGTTWCPNVLLMRLYDRIGINGKVLCWFRSYLTARTQYVKPGSATSATQCIQWGVPQRSVLGPVLFTVYTSPLGDLVRSYGVSYHLYADAADTDSQGHCLTTLENCITAIRAWMASNFLKLNNDKTEFLIIGNKLHLKKVTFEWFDSIKVGDASVNNSPVARNIGAILDENLNMDQHVQSICRSAYAHIRLETLVSFAIFYMLMQLHSNKQTRLSELSPICHNMGFQKLL